MTQNKTSFKEPIPEGDIFNRRLIKSRRDNNVERFKSHDFLNREISERLLDNLKDIKRDFKTILSMNIHDQIIDDHLKPDDIFFQDLSYPVLKSKNGMSVQGDEEYLPYKNQCLDLTLSCLNLHWINDLPGTLIQILRCLKPDGMFLAAIFGGDTLTELRQSMLKADMDHLGGISPHISPFIDVRDAGGLMQRAGFALPVVSQERINVTYSDAFALMKELKGMGENNALNKRFKGLSSRQLMMKVAEHYHQDFANEQGRITATFDIVYLQGWAPHESQQQPLKPGSAKMALKDALGIEPPKS